MTKTMRIQGMSCGHCAMKVREALEKVEGIETAEVNQKKGIAKIVSDRAIPLDRLKAAVDETGYVLVGETD